MPNLTLPANGKASSGTVRRWLKRTGQPVRSGEVLLEFETDDGLVEIESAVGGTLREIHAPAGKSLGASALLAIVGDETAAPPPKPKTSGEPMTAKVTPILMPQAGQSMEEGTIVKWRVAAGDNINKGDIIFEVETDKATMEVEATDSGRLARIILPEGGTLKVLEPVAYLADNDADVDAFLKGSGFGGQVSGNTSAPSVATEAPPVASDANRRSEPAPTSDTGRVKASPAARKLASERGVDLSTVGAGSGPQGRVLSTDIPATAAKPASPPATQAAPAANAEGVKRKRMSQMRKAIARNLSLSKQTIPHFYVKLTVNAETLYNFYQAEKAKYPCSLNDVVVLACARAVSEFPAFRSRLEGDEIVELPTSNIGIAVGMDDGLVVPVLIGAEKLTLKQVGLETKRLAVNARSGKIEGMGQGVFTITNLGMFGVEEFSAIINPPEAAILAVGAAREQVIVSGGTLKAGRVMTMVLSADHRIIDGALAAKFMARLKEILEYPAQLT